MRELTDEHTGADALPESLEQPTLPPRVRERPSVLPSRSALTPAGVARMYVPHHPARRFPAWVVPTAGAMSLAGVALALVWLGFSALQVETLGERVAEADRVWVEEGLRAVRGVRSLGALGIAAPAELDTWVDTLKDEDVAARREAAVAVEGALTEALADIDVVPVADRERVLRARALLDDLQGAELAARQLHEERYAARMSIGGRMVRLTGVVD